MHDTAYEENRSESLEQIFAAGIAKLLPTIAKTGFKEIDEEQSKNDYAFDLFSVLQDKPLAFKFESFTGGETFYKEGGRLTHPPTATNLLYSPSRKALGLRPDAELFLQSDRVGTIRPLILRASLPALHLHAD